MSTQNLLNHLTSQSNENQLTYIYDLKYRWKDEREYEDFKNYQSAIKSQVTCVDVISITKGFSMVCVFEGQKYNVKFNNNAIKASKLT